MQTPEQQAELWNRRHGVGEKVLYWRGAKVGRGHTGYIESKAFVLEGHTAVVMVKPAGMIAISHVECDYFPRGYDEPEAYEASQAKKSHASSLGGCEAE